MKLTEKIKREIFMRPFIREGYSRRMAASWYKYVKADNRNYGDRYTAEELASIHRRGFLARSIEKYDLFNNPDCDYITDFEYIFIHPLNNSFSKWIDDMITTSRILSSLPDFHRQIYFSIIKRDGRQCIFRINDETREYTVKDVYELVKEKKILELRPAHWLSKRSRYRLSFEENIFKIDDKESSFEELTQIITAPDANYIVADYVDLAYGRFGDKERDGYIKFYVANDCGEQPVILDAYMNLLTENPEADPEEEDIFDKTVYKIDMQAGTFEFDGIHKIENWAGIMKGISDTAAVMKQLSFFSVSVHPQDRGFIFLNFSASPVLPSTGIGDMLNSYLKNKFSERKSHSNLTLSDRVNAIRRSRFYKFVAKHCRPGIRPYMQRLWFNAVKDDLLHTRIGLGKKIWAWKRGFLSYRIWQYGLTEENYKNFLSDYDYYWLNRINNHYQIWINDKTTFRYIFEPFRDYIPKYYFSIFKRNYATNIVKMQDAPAEVPEGYEGIFAMLEKEKMLALKPSSGTHGDGFYCLAYDENGYYVNGQNMTKEEIIEKIESFRSFYLITEYITMNAQLKKIYDKSVNSVRMMVINRNGYDPKIMQAYMRIGSSSTGYTDNVGYGGICVMVDVESGEMYNPERIVNHIFEACPEHPDTGVKIEGKIPNWETVCENVLAMCRYVPEIEYLGFDVAITDEAFQIIEINIHQDLHKVATHSEEIKSFFRDKIKNKRMIEERKKLLK